MKRVLLILSAILIASTISFRLAEGMQKPIQAEIALYGGLNTSCISTHGGTVYLQMEIATSDIRDDKRKPMNIAVVLDRSGSMADERKLDYAKSAIKALIKQLSSDDYLSLVIYDDQVETLLANHRVTDNRNIQRMIDDVYPRGATNLGGGMIEGFRLIEHSRDREYINRVILLSDGLANRGITNPHELAEITRRYRNQSISLTTIGVGLDYNENLMLSLAEHGGGNYYFIESPSQLASIFEKECHSLNSVLVQNAEIELSLGRGIELTNVIGCEWTHDDAGWHIPIGDIYSNEHREITVQLSLPAGKGISRVAEGILSASGINKRFNHTAHFSVDIRYTDNITELDRSIDKKIQAKVDVARSTEIVQSALNELDAGHRGNAVRYLNEAKETLQNSAAVINNPAGAAMIEDQILSINHYSQALKDERADKRQLKKSIQFENYRIQKKK